MILFNTRIDSKVSAIWFLLSPFRYEILKKQWNKKYNEYYTDFSIRGGPF